jgi:hypothetical protein
MQRYLAILRWDNFGAPRVSRSGVVIYSDDRARLIAEVEGVEHGPISDPFDLPEGRWFSLEVRQRLSSTAGSALNEVYVDGVLVATSTERNYFGEPVRSMRYGIVAVDDGAQTAALSTLVDDAFLLEEAGRHE